MISPESEYVVLADEEGTPIGEQLKSQVHHEETPLHLAFSLFLFNAKGQTLVQQRALSKKTWPGIWSNACCGHPLPAESYDHAIRRRLKDELGIDLANIHLALPYFRYRAYWQDLWENEICPVYIGLYDGPVSSDPSEVHETKWIDWTSFLEASEDPIGTPFENFSPWSLEEVKQLRDSSVLNSLLNLNDLSLSSSV
jgi:isopentenyl-diphosphate delta-isomerase type 1